AVLFIETSGCLPMCGHGTIGTITIAIEEGLIKPKVKGVVRMETPAGLVEVEYRTVGSYGSALGSQESIVDSRESIVDSRESAVDSPKSDQRDRSFKVES